MPLLDLSFCLLSREIPTWILFERIRQARAIRILVWNRSSSTFDDVRLCRANRTSFSRFPAEILCRFKIQRRGKEFRLCGWLIVKTKTLKYQLFVSDLDFHTDVNFAKTDSSTFLSVSALTLTCFPTCSPFSGTTWWFSPKSLNNENHWIWFNHKLPPSPVTDPSQCSWSHNVVITYWSHCAPLSPGLWWCSVCAWWRPLVYWLDTTWSAPPCPTMPCHDYLPPHQLAPLVSYSLHYASTDTQEDIRRYPG